MPKPYDVVFDDEVMDGKLPLYDWLHLHHEDFTGQFGRFYASFKDAPWYQAEVREANETAKRYGFSKVSQLKLAVVHRIRDFVTGGGFLFAMCSATDTYDIALSAEDVDICESMYDGDPPTLQHSRKLTLAKPSPFTTIASAATPSSTSTAISTLPKHGALWLNKTTCLPYSTFQPSGILYPPCSAKTIRR